MLMFILNINNYFCYNIYFVAFLNKKYFLQYLSIYVKH